MNEVEAIVVKKSPAASGRWSARVSVRNQRTSSLQPSASNSVEWFLIRQHAVAEEEAVNFFASDDSRMWKQPTAFFV
jgi:hypothetical protein